MDAGSEVVVVLVVVVEVEVEVEVEVVLVVVVVEVLVAVVGVKGVRALEGCDMGAVFSVTPKPP